MKKNDIYYILDPDNLGTTRVRIMKFDEETQLVTVKYQADVWNLDTGLITNRKGSVRMVTRDRLSKFSTFFF